MKYLDGTRNGERKRKEGAKSEGIKKEDSLRRAGRKLRGKGKRIKERERGHEERRFFRAGWRRLDFISSCRFDVPDACRWPASAFLTNSSPRRPLISALRPVPVPIFISLPLYCARLFNHAQTEACVRACECKYTGEEISSNCRRITENGGRLHAIPTVTGRD